MFHCPISETHHSLGSKGLVKPPSLVLPSVAHSLFQNLIPNLIHICPAISQSLHYRWNCTFTPSRMASFCLSLLRDSRPTQRWASFLLRPVQSWGLNWNWGCVFTSWPLKGPTLSLFPWPPQSRRFPISKTSTTRETLKSYLVWKAQDIVVIQRKIRL